jgi:hypothetical protein
MESSFKKRNSPERKFWRETGRIVSEEQLASEDQSLVRQIIREWDNNR